MNAAPLPAGPSYTSIYTQFDQLIYPQPRASTLDGGTSIAVQDICPLRPVEHFGILGDNVVYQLVLDALTHDGAADPTRIHRSVCFTTMMPGTDPAISAEATDIFYPLTSLIRLETDSVANEPELADYARQ